MKSSLKQFKMSTILFDNVDSHGPVIFIIGRRDTGSTWSFIFLSRYSNWYNYNW